MATRAPEPTWIDDDDALSGTGVVRQLADQAFSRAAGAPLIQGNAVRLLVDARENYPAWLEAIDSARDHVHFECYILHDDAVGNRFADTLIAKAKDGVHVRLIYDWVGGWNTSGKFWKRLREGGVDVRCFNRPRLSEPMNWLMRDHRKSLVIDATVAYVTGLCVGQVWEGDPAKGIEPWRDTGVEVRGPAVADVARAFADAWAACGPRLPRAAEIATPEPAGEIALRVVAGTVGTAGLYRLDPLVAALARSTLWLTDAYYAGTPTYVAALRAAARDGVDVRLLVPGRGSDIAVMQAISRSGYRPLLDAGVRVFEWNGPMLHAKTAVADGRWARVGSTNLNLASWIGNWELDIVVEDEGFGGIMTAQYEKDLESATEIVLEQRRRVRPVGERRRRTRGTGGTAARAAAGALRLSNAIGSVLASRRVLGPAEQRLMGQAGFVLAVFGLLAIFAPKVVAWPFGLVCLWLAMTLVGRALRRPPRPR